MSINPNQIRPYGSDGELVGTLAGATVPLKVTAGAGISVTLVGNEIVIATTGAVVPLTIDSFTGGAAEELGFSVVNPAFAASYTGTPTSANITNTDSIDSPHNLTTPFTAATLAGTFVHTTVATTTFTLHATDGMTSPTATQTITWNPRIFGGVGVDGATSTVTASGTTAHLSTGDVLASLQLGAEAVNEVFGPFVTTGNRIYLLLIGGSHTFTDNGTGFPFAFNAPVSVSFTNVNGTVVSMNLYESQNDIFGTFNVKVAS